MLSFVIFFIHTFISLLTGVLLMRGFFPNDNPLERNNPKKILYKRNIASGRLAVALLGVLSLYHGVETESIRRLSSPTLLCYHLVSNMVQWNTPASGTRSALISPHLFLSLGFGTILFAV